MIDIKRRKVKAIYHNAFCCPECGLELHRDNIVLTTYPAQYCYFCDCGFRTTSYQLPGYEVEFEDEKFESFTETPVNDILGKIADAYVELGSCPNLVEFTTTDSITPLSGFIRCDEPHYRERNF